LFWELQTSEDSGDAALLMIPLPIGAIGFVKARYCPLVTRKQDPDAEKTST